MRLRQLECCKGMDDQEFLSLTSDIVSAYVSNNSVQRSDLAELISEVHRPLRDARNPQAKAPEPAGPAVPIKKSITPDYLISLEDGRPYKSLKRHLTGRGLTPQVYRTKWGLPRDYPMVAENYARQRSELAKMMGLGQRRSKSAEGGEGEAAAPRGDEAANPKRGRKAKAEA
jgi:predicted transcriptional regulator